MGRLTGKVAFVTGAGQGIGRGIALALAGDGAAIAVVGRTLDKLESTVAEIQSRGGTALAVQADVSNLADVQQAVADVVENLGGLDILVNNAQEYAFGPIAGVDLDSVEAGWQSGAMGTLRCMQTAHPHLAGGGVVVNVSSGVVSDPSPSTGPYAAVKAAIEALTRTAALEWAEDGIRAVALVPFARTPAVVATIDAYPGLEDQILSEVPLRRFGDSEQEIGKAVSFLASSDASFVTGSTLAVDGGSTYVR